VRLARLERGQRPKQRLILLLIRLTQRREPPDVLKTLFYRPELFGTPFSAACHAVLRGPSEWSVGERELFAAFTSSLNQCPF
jgi:hypothetical protein